MKIVWREYDRNYPENDHHRPGTTETPMFPIIVREIDKHHGVLTITWTK